ncbi:MAG TPA: TIGR03619 family F420-dependent LLM class oxidoreductase [Candidatus Binatia bacterium]|nr:TIGR03619 family F420-dependent LLM class oxidoreductase [Candidatus Binatia bacterium]
MSKIDFAIQTAGGQVHHDRSGIETIVAEARMAEDLGFGVVYVPDHYVFERLGVLQTEAPAYDVFFVLATLAQRTKTIRLGSQVVCMLFRHPAMTARLFAEIDEASDGRVVAGVGAGWTRAEFDMLGLEFPPVSERLRIMDEAVEVMRGLWRNERYSFDGEYFRLADAMIRPRPVQQPGPPLLLGGSGNGILRRAGRWADMIHMTPAIGAEGTTTLPTVAAFTDATIAEKLALVREEAVRAGRAPDAVRYGTTIYSYAPTDSAAATKSLAEQMAPLFQVSPADFLRHPVSLVGTPEEMVDEIHRRVATHGLAEMTINFASPEQLRAFGERVLPRV